MSCFVSSRGRRVPFCAFAGVMVAGLVACGGSDAPTDSIPGDLPELDSGTVRDLPADLLTDEYSDPDSEYEVDAGDADSDAVDDASDSELSDSGQNDIHDGFTDGLDQDQGELPVDTAIDSDGQISPDIVDTFEMPTDENSCLAAGFCWISESCHLPGAVDPARPCWSCQPLANPGEWTVMVDESVCNDDNPGTYDDICVSGECNGTFLNCPVYSGQCDPVAHPDGTSNCNYEYPVGVACDDENLCTCNDSCDSQGNCTGTPVACPIVINPCYPQGHCDGSCGCVMDPWPGQETSCSIPNGSGHCDGAGGCELVSCSDGFTESFVTPGTCVRAFVSISAGDSHTCAVTSDNRPYCWGDNGYGQVGDGSSDDRLVPTPVSGLTGVSGVAAGQDFTCAWTTAGAVWCWGHNNVGQLGDGSNTDSEVPVAVSGLQSGVTRVAAGALHACALKGGETWCWGSNGSGQVGVDSTTAWFNTPRKVALTDAISIDCGGQHTCAITFQENPICWGDNQSGQLGVGDTVNLLKPTRLVNEHGVAGRVGLGAQYTCVEEWVGIGYGKYLLSLSCWGSDSHGQLAGKGDSTCVTGSCTTDPETSAFWEDLMSLPLPPPPGAGAFHSCYINSSGALLCVGFNDFGQIGNNTTAGYQVFQQIFESGASAVTAGGNHTCALVNSELLCWGRNTDGQLGDTSTLRRLVPVRVAW